MKQVHAEFSKLFEMKLSNFLQELLSVLLTPFILILSLPRSAAAIVDFFREFTVHVDGIGYVCSFAVFDFKRQGKVSLRAFGQPLGVVLSCFRELSSFSCTNRLRKTRTRGSRCSIVIARWKRASYTSRYIVPYYLRDNDIVQEVLTSVSSFVSDHESGLAAVGSRRVSLSVQGCRIWRTECQ